MHSTHSSHLSEFAPLSFVWGSSSNHCRGQQWPHCIGKESGTHRKWGQSTHRDPSQWGFSFHRWRWSVPQFATPVPSAATMLWSSPPDDLLLHQNSRISHLYWVHTLCCEQYWVSYLIVFFNHNLILIILDYNRSVACCNDCLSPLWLLGHLFSFLSLT